jgi:hypothetical protein
MADEEGLRIQCKSNKLFSSFFSKQFISAEVHYLLGHVDGIKV